MTPEDRSKQAKALINDPVLKEALDTIADRAVSEWRNSNPTEHQKREEAWQALKAVEALRSELSQIAADAAVRAFNAKKKLS